MIVAELAALAGRMGFSALTMRFLLARDQFQLNVEAAGASLPYRVHIDPHDDIREIARSTFGLPALSPAPFVRQEAEHLRSFATVNLAVRTETEQAGSYRNFY